MLKEKSTPWTREGAPNEEPLGQREAGATPGGILTVLNPIPMDVCVVAEGSPQHQEVL